MIDDKYLLQELLDGGSFGKVYRALNIRTQQQVAIKVVQECTDAHHFLLKHEFQIYQYLNRQHTQGVPLVKWFKNCKQNNVSYLVLELLGESLHSYWQTHSYSPDIGIQMLHLLRNIHQQGIIHRDIKPSNFVWSNANNTLCLIDYGFAKSWLDKEIHTDVTKRDTLIGSICFASIAAHLYKTQTPCDDLESLGYVLLYAVNKNKYLLPWQHSDQQEALAMKLQFKENILQSKNIYKKNVHWLQAYFALVYSPQFAPNYVDLQKCMNP